MANIGKILTSGQSEIAMSLIPIDESVCGIIFDTSTRPDIFDNEEAGYYFSDNNVVKITNLRSIEELGVNGQFMDGIPYYHIKQYYDYLGADKDLYVMFADMVTYSDSPIELMVMQSGCKVFQIGVWSEYPMFNLINSSTVGISDFVKNINDSINIIGGTDEMPSGYPSSVNVVLCGGTSGVLDYHYLPDLKLYDYSNISILIGQDSYDKVSNMLSNTQVGMLGLAMACLTMAGAEESIAYVKKFNLNKDDKFAGVEFNLNGKRTPIDSIPDILISEIAEKGYIFPIRYEAIEGGVYFCSDDVMSDGVYNRISKNRIAQKCRRIIKRTLVNEVNGVVYYDHYINNLSSSSITIITSQINDAIDKYMVNNDGQEQMAAYVTDIPSYQEELENDKLTIEFMFVTLETQDEINFVENYKTTR